MKKLVILVLFSLIGLTTMAQSLPINIGIHGGWNDAKIKAKEYKVDSHGGYMIGAFARINLGSIYLEPALNFAHKESKINDEIGSIGKFKYSSIDIPVMVGFKKRFQHGQNDVERENRSRSRCMESNFRY